MQVRLEPNVKKLVVEFSEDKETVAKFAPSKDSLSCAYLVNAMLFQILTKWKENKEKK